MNARRAGSRTRALFMDGISSLGVRLKDADRRREGDSPSGTGPPARDVLPSFLVSWRAHGGPLRTTPRTGPPFHVRRPRHPHAFDGAAPAAGCAGTLYTVAAFGWTWCFVAARAWNGALTAVSAVLWPLFLYANAGPLLPAALAPSPAFVAAGNGAGFVLLQVWFVVVAEQVLRRSRPAALHGRMAPWRHPNPPLGAVLDPFPNTRSAPALADSVPP